MSLKFDQITRAPINSVPTNIITGFLGVGKTSAILHLIKNKPEQERWAVLVNEFGEIGIDGSLFESQCSEQQGIYIREVPGGCMCCTAGLPMQVALAQLLRQTKPDRLLIEPTGLGHPNEVLETLRSHSFHDVLLIQKVVTLVDARQLSDSRYAEHETFQQQVAIADVIIGNKQDLYGKDDRAVLEAYLKEHARVDVPVFFTEQGVIEPSLLEGVNAIESGATHYDLSPNKGDMNNFNEPIPESGFIKALNQGEGFVSVGWRLSPRFIFDRNALFTFLSGVDAERLKATFITNEGCFAYNLTKDAMTEVTIESIDESRIEIIATEINDGWQTALFDCTTDGNSLAEQLS